MSLVEMLPPLVPVDSSEAMLLHRVTLANVATPDDEVLAARTKELMKDMTAFKRRKPVEVSFDAPTAEKLYCGLWLTAAFGNSVDALGARAMLEDRLNPEAKAARWDRPVNETVLAETAARIGLATELASGLRKERDNALSIDPTQSVDNPTIEDLLGMREADTEVMSRSISLSIIREKVIHPATELVKKVVHLAA